MDGTNNWGGCFHEAWNPYFTRPGVGKNAKVATTNHKTRESRENPKWWEKWHWLVSQSSFSALFLCLLSCYCKYYYDYDWHVNISNRCEILTENAIHLITWDESCISNKLFHVQKGKYMSRLQKAKTYHLKESNNKKTVFCSTRSNNGKINTAMPGICPRLLQGQKLIGLKIKRL